MTEAWEVIDDDRTSRATTDAAYQHSCADRTIPVGDATEEAAAVAFEVIRWVSE
jgi:hypothetical protein